MEAPDTPDRYRVMVVDDEESSLRAFEEVLRQDFEVIGARDGYETLHKLPTVEPDLLMLDVAMPGMDGFETCQAIRQQPVFRDLQIIFLSAQDDQDTVRKTYACGANLFVKKPIEATRLIKNIRLSLERTGPPRKKRFSVESLKSGAWRQGLPGPSAEPTPRPAWTARGAASPAAEAAPRAEARPAAPADPSPSPSRAAPSPFPAPGGVGRMGARPKPRLMVVDDDPEAVTLLELALQEAYEVVSARDGIEAIERIGRYEPDVLLIDIMMPKMNGFQLCQSLRRTPAYRTAPILFLTAKSGRKDREYANRCGADAYVTKPFDVKKLHELIETIVAKPAFQTRPKTWTLLELKRLERTEALDREDRRYQRDLLQQYDNLQDFIDRHL